MLPANRPTPTLPAPQFLHPDGCRRLCALVVLQAVEDHRRLGKRASAHLENQTVTKASLGAFWHGQVAKFFLHGAGLHINAKRIRSALARAAVVPHGRETRRIRSAAQFALS